MAANQTEKLSVNITHLPSGVLRLGETQYWPGYCVLFAEPQVPSLNDLSGDQRGQFLADMARVGDAVMTVCQPLRINYAIFGNSYPVLHAHIIPRYEWEPAEMKPKNPWAYAEEIWSGAEYAYAPEKHEAMLQDIKRRLENIAAT